MLLSNLTIIYIDYILIQKNKVYKNKHIELNSVRLTALQIPNFTTFIIHLRAKYIRKNFST